MLPFQWFQSVGPVRRAIGVGVLDSPDRSLLSRSEHDTGRKSLHRPTERADSSSLPRRYDYLSRVIEIPSVIDRLPILKRPDAERDQTEPTPLRDRLAGDSHIESGRSFVEKHSHSSSSVLSVERLCFT